ncbi:hypothetical protein ACHAXS_012330 [Conticribra weissflogii]
MKFSVGTYLQTILALEQRTTFSTIESSNDPAGVPCYDKFVSIDACVVSHKRTDEQMGQCEDCIDNAGDQLNDVVTCEDFQSSDYCQDIKTCVLEQCVADCYDEFVELQVCLQKAYNSCYFCVGDETAVSFA